MNNQSSNPGIEGTPVIDLPDGWYQNTTHGPLFIAVRNKRAVLWLQNMKDPNVSGNEKYRPTLPENPVFSQDVPKHEPYEDQLTPVFYKQNSGISSYCDARYLKLYQRFVSPPVAEPGWAPTLLAVAGALTGLGFLNSRKKVATKAPVKAVKHVVQDKQVEAQETAAKK